MSDPCLPSLPIPVDPDFPFGPEVSSTLLPYEAEHVDGPDFTHFTTYEFGDFQIINPSDDFDLDVPKTATFRYIGSDLAKDWHPHLVANWRTTYPGLNTLPQTSSAADFQVTGPGEDDRTVTVDSVTSPVKTYTGTLYAITETTYFGALLIQVSFGTEGFGVPFPPDSAYTVTDEDLYQIDIDYEAGYSSFTATWYFDDTSVDTSPTVAVSNAVGGSLTIYAPDDRVAVAVEISATDFDGDPTGVILRHYY